MALDTFTEPPEQDMLAQALERILGEPVASLCRLSAGASRETWSFDAGSRELVLRRDPPHAPDADGMAREAECFRAAAASLVPVPGLVAQGDGSDGVGSPYLIMERVRGETLPPRLLRDERWASVRPRLTSQLGEVLGRIHATPPTDVPRLPRLDGASGALAELRAQHEVFREHRPAMELIFRRLADTLPTPVPATLVHGDFRNGNLMIDEGGVRAVLDWELAHVGDPREDIGWLCARAWRFGRRLEVGGFGRYEELAESYGRVTGGQPDRDAVRWWEVLACAKWAVLCRIQAERHLGGSEQSVEMAVLGRRTAEAEYDALLALGLLSPRDVDDPLHSAPAVTEVELYDRPSVDELLGAVAGFLSDELIADDPRSAYLARVARNALAIARRELRVGTDARTSHHRHLDALGCADDAELATRIRDGHLPHDAPDVIAAVCGFVIDQVIVTNPRYLASASR
jgi:aminoglycoside phosphotransferase (APT) family kinase protein